MFELNGIKYNFRRVSVETGLEIQSLMDNKDSFENQKRLALIAVDHLQVFIKDKGKEVMIDGMDLDYYGDLFENPLYTIEIVLSFGEVIKGFLELLPSFRRGSVKKEKVKAIVKS